MLVFTDGEENMPPYIDDVKKSVCSYGATIYGILVSQIAFNHPLITLSEQTCGRSCIYDDKVFTSMYDCLWDAIKSRLPQLSPVEVFSKYNV